MIRSHLEAQVSVVIPMRAPVPWLRLALESVAKQRLKPSEVICVVDGFDQDLLDFLKCWSSVQVLINEKPQGPASARNLGIEASRGEFVALLDADDEWAPDHLSNLVGKVLIDKRLVLVGSRGIKVDSLGRRLGIIGGSARATRVKLLLRNQFVNSGVLFHRETAVALGLLNASVRVCEDYDLWLRLAAVGSVQLLGDKPSVTYRVSASGVSSESINQSSRNAVRLSRRKLARALKLPAVVPEVLQWAWERHLDGWSVTSGRRQ